MREMESEEEGERGERGRNREGETYREIMIYSANLSRCA